MPEVLLGALMNSSPSAGYDEIGFMHRQSGSTQIVFQAFLFCMKVDRTKFTAQYENGVVKSMWVSVEVALDPGLDEHPETALDLSKEIADEWYKKNNPHGLLIPSMPEVTPHTNIGVPDIQVQKTPEEVRIGVMVEDIESCKDKKTLETYRLLIKHSPALQEAYNKRHKELLNQ